MHAPDFAPLSPGLHLAPFLSTEEHAPMLAAIDADGRLGALFIAKELVPEPIALDPDGEEFAEVWGATLAAGALRNAIRAPLLPPGRHRCPWHPRLFGAHGIAYVIVSVSGRLELYAEELTSQSREVAPRITAESGSR